LKLPSRETKAEFIKSVYQDEMLKLSEKIQQLTKEKELIPYTLVQTISAIWTKSSFIGGGFKLSLLQILDMFLYFIQSHSTKFSSQMILAELKREKKQQKFHQKQTEHQVSMSEMVSRKEMMDCIQLKMKEMKVTHKNTHSGKGKGSQLKGQPETQQNGHSKKKREMNGNKTGKGNSTNSRKSNGKKQNGNTRP
jgi:hypothetical protein